MAWLARKLSLLLLMLLPLNLMADEDAELRVIALFKNAAMVDFNGKQKLYRAGQKLSPKIKLIEANSVRAVFDINGQRQEMGLKGTASFSGTISKPATKSDNSGAKKTAKIRRNSMGMYRTPGFINGIAVDFLVDTGASQVAMNERVARKVGLLYELDGFKVGVNTAAGAVSAWAVKLKKVKVGSIELKQVDALVVKGTGPGEVLLGMSFLQQLKMENDGQFMSLTKKY